MVELRQVGRATDRHRVIRISHLDGFANLQTINLSGNLIRTIEGLAALPRLTSLDLSANRIRDMEGVAALTSLRRLDVSGNFVSRIPAGEGARCSFLVSGRLGCVVTLRSCGGAAVCAAPGIRKLVALTELRMAGNNLSVLKDVDNLASLLNLVTVNLTANPFCDLPHYTAYVHAPERVALLLLLLLLLLLCVCVCVCVCVVSPRVHARYFVRFF